MNEEDHGNHKEKWTLTDILLTSQYSQFSVIWNFIDKFCCIFSSYLYMFMSVFQREIIGETPVIIALCFETIFLLTIIKTFLTEYTPDGETQPVKSLSKIAKQYIRT